MEPKPVPNQTPKPEPATTRRPLDPFFETGEQRDHANQWDVTTVWPAPADDKKKSKPAVDKE